eukprot:CAMPEP_0185776812 /NCGR_PEP_ID=MMETSP1174-20130828/87149_1 /TAXON_ID=35687 /ORGANISM="Dictyocha speculum, Strain CCMP1381" /LENGTH=356 /DNA_ID=CAMNT_0028464945 /DNA_START=26 /DNA_END=1093 /DNA_ORIENTATION=-
MFRHLLPIVLFWGLCSIALGFTLSPKPLARCRSRAQFARGMTTRMDAVAPGGKVVVVGSGPILALTAKRAALAGYETNVVVGTSAKMYQDLIFGYIKQYKNKNLKLGGMVPMDEKVKENLKFIESISGDDEEAFDALISSCDAVLIAIDSDAAMSDALLDLIIPTPAMGGKDACSAKRIIAMSRNLNGKGLGPFAIAAKIASNPDVWAGGEAINDYKRFDATVKRKAAELGAEYVIARAGTLKGGGGGLNQNADEGVQRMGLAPDFYAMGAQDIVNWRLLFDGSCQGVKLTRGDTVEGPGFGAAFAATAFDIRPGDTGRTGIAGAMVHALSHPEGNYDFGVGSAEAKTPPISESEW